MSTPRLSVATHYAYLVTLCCAVLAVSERYAAAQTVCAPQAAQPFFINGVNNDWIKAEIARAQLQFELESKLGPGCVVVHLAYNDNEPFLLDFFEAARQLGAGTGLFWRLWYVAGSLTGSPLLEALTDLFFQSLFGIDLSTYVDGSELADHLAAYQTEIDAGRRIVLVGHSHGNIYANRAHQALGPGLGQLAASTISLVAVATPDSFVAGGGPHTTLLEDRIHRLPHALEWNATNGFLCLSIEGCHGFAASYLFGPSSGPQIIQQILTAMRNRPPTAGFTMSAGAQSATDGQTLSVATAPGGSVSVDLSAAGRSHDPDGNVVGWTWTVDGATQPNVGETFSYPFAIGSHVVTLVVTDNQGAPSTPVQGTIVVSEALPPPLPVASDDGPYTMTQGTTLTVSGPGLLENDIFPFGVAPVVDFQTFPPGNLQNLGDGAFSYEPPSNVVGPVTFTYLLHTPSGDSNIATVTIQVNPPLLYSLTDLGDLPGGANQSSATSINEAGTLIVGVSSGASDADYSGCGSSGAGKPFLWSTSTAGMQALGPTPLLDLGVGVPLGPCGGVATGVNDRDDVVGHLDYGFAGRTRSFIWNTATGMQLINSGSPGGATAVNNAGQVAGVAGASAYRWTATGGFESLAIAAQNSSARAINSSGLVAGLAQIVNCGSQSAVIWDVVGQVQYLDLAGAVAPLPTYKVLCNQVAHGINDDGVTVGSVHVVFVSGETRTLAFIATSNGAQALGDLPYGPSGGNLSTTEAFDINNNDQVVGSSNGRAFRWTASTGIEDLNSLLDLSSAGWTLISAYAINDKGQIVGYGFYNGEQRAFLLTPTGIVPQ